jgi:hypothetical protein
MYLKDAIDAGRGDTLYIIYANDRKEHIKCIVISD